MNIKQDKMELINMTSSEATINVNGKEVTIFFEVEYLAPIVSRDESGKSIIREPMDFNILSIFNDEGEETEIPENEREKAIELIWNNLTSRECSDEEIESLRDRKNRRYLYEI